MRGLKRFWYFRGSEPLFPLLDVIFQLILLTARLSVNSKGYLVWEGLLSNDRRRRGNWRLVLLGLQQTVENAGGRGSSESVLAFKFGNRHEVPISGVESGTDFGSVNDDFESIVDLGSLFLVDALVKGLLNKASQIERPLLTWVLLYKRRSRELNSLAYEALRRLVAKVRKAWWKWSNRSREMQLLIIFKLLISGIKLVHFPLFQWLLPPAHLWPFLSNPSLLLVHSLGHLISRNLGVRVERSLGGVRIAVLRLSCLVLLHVGLLVIHWIRLHVLLLSVRVVPWLTEVLRSSSIISLLVVHVRVNICFRVHSYIARSPVFLHRRFHTRGVALRTCSQHSVRSVHSNHLPRHRWVGHIFYFIISIEKCLIRIRVAHSFKFYGILLSNRIRTHIQIVKQHFTLINTKACQSLDLLRILCVKVLIASEDPGQLCMEDPVVWAGINYWEVVIVCLYDIIISVKRPEECKS